MVFVLVFVVCWFCLVFWVFDHWTSLISSVADLRILCDDWRQYSCQKKNTANTQQHWSAHRTSGDAPATQIKVALISVHPLLQVLMEFLLCEFHLPSFLKNLILGAPLTKKNQLKRHGCRSSLQQRPSSFVSKHELAPPSSFSWLLRQ